MRFAFRFSLIAFCALNLVRADAALAAPSRINIGQTFLTNSLDPGDGSAGWALTSHGVGEKLFTVDSKGQIVGDVAQGIESRSDGSWLVTLRS